MTLYILLTTPTTDAGPFNLYSNTDDYTSAFAVNINVSTLLSGYVAFNVPAGTTNVRITSVGAECNNYIEVPVGGGPAPTTTTTTTAFNTLTWYYGKYNSIGGIVSIPTSTNINIATGTVVSNVDPSGTITIPFNSGVSDFLWFAIPVLVGTKSNWFVTPLNQGLIGGPSNQFGNLFSNPATVTYNNVSLYLYISTVRTNVEQITIS